MTTVETLFLSISDILGSRVTPENYRVKMKDIRSTRGITNKDKTDIIVEMLAALIALEEKLDEKTSS
ncbi:MAG TPA: hypothetical protein ENI23_01025 [bacterium]|nr:hypothetical protein [bacterium]